MIHSGAIIGAGVPQFRSMFFKKFTLPYPYFRSDRSVEFSQSCIIFSPLVLMLTATCTSCFTTSSYYHYCCKTIM